MKLKKTLLITGKIDDFMIVFSMKKARDGTWAFFNQIHKAQQEDWNHFIPSRDQKVAKIIYFINYIRIIIFIYFTETYNF